MSSLRVFSRKIIIINTVTEQCPTLFSSIQNYNNESHAKQHFFNSKVNLSVWQLVHEDHTGVWGNYHCCDNVHTHSLEVPISCSFYLAQFELLVLQVRQKERILFQSSSFLMTDCKIRTKFTKEYHPGDCLLHLEHQWLCVPNPSRNIA